jgi:hypothetical protein
MRRGACPSNDFLLHDYYLLRLHRQHKPNKNNLCLRVDARPSGMGGMFRTNSKNVGRDC